MGRLELRVVTADDFLPPIHSWTTRGGMLLLGAFGTAIALASVLKYNVSVKASAIVRPLGDLRIVQAATDGTVKQIAVKENQVIHQGDVIAYMEDSQLQTQKSQLQTSIQQETLQIAQINAQLQALIEQIRAETDQMHRTISAAKADLSRNQRNYQDKQAITVAEVQEVEAEVELAENELASYRQLVTTGAIAQLQLKQKEAALKTAKARLARIKTVLNPSDAEVAIAREKIAQEQAQGVGNLARLQQEQEQLGQKKSEIQSQLNRDRKALQQTAIDLQRTIIRAPVAGVIQELTLRNPHQVLRAGDKIAQVAPSHVPLKIKALVAAQDINQVKPGQIAYMRVSACPYPDYGTLRGTVSSISPDVLMEGNLGGDRTPTSSHPNPHSGGEGLYSVTIQPDRSLLTAGQQKCAIQPGTEGTVEIVSKHETVFTFVLRKARLSTSL